MSKYNSIFFQLFIFAALSVFFCACNNRDATTSINEETRKVIIKMIADYEQGWLANDSAKVLALFSDTATIIPSGLSPLRGKRSMKQFWWPDDGSKTFIDRYHIRILELNVDDNYAYTYENGKLSWRYEKGDVKISKDNESYEITIFRKSNGSWKIVKRIWTDLK